MKTRLDIDSPCTPVESAPRAASNLAAYDPLPQEMRGGAQWVAWKEEDRSGKLTKIPINPSTGRGASVTDPSTWGPLQESLDAALGCGLSGIGFVLTEEAGIVGIDLDDCRDAATGILDPMAERIVKRFDSYTEVSPSGCGIHIFVRGKLPSGTRRRGGVEMYDSGRYFTVTGSRVETVSGKLEHRQEALDALHAWISKDAKVVGEAHKRSDSRFPLLWDGRWEEAKYPSQSEADLALCNMLVRYTKDPTQLDRIFRWSGLMREKWDEIRRDGKTYGEIAIEKALEPQKISQVEAGVPENAGSVLPLFSDIGTRRLNFGILTPKQLSSRVVELGATEYLIEDFLPKQSLSLLIGESGLGKSPLLYQLAMCVASGKPFLGHATKQGRVLFLDCENGLELIESTLAKICKSLGLASAPEDLLLWPSSDCTDVPMIRELMESVHPVLVIADPLKFFFPQIENSSELTIGAFKELRQTMAGERCSVMGVHHLRKQSRRRGEARISIDSPEWRDWFNEARGARELINGCDRRIGLDASSPDGDRLVMRHWGRGCSHAPLVQLMRILDENGDPIGFKPVSGIELISNSAQQDAFNRLPDKFRHKDAMEVYGRSPQPTTDFLNKAIDAGLLRRLPGKSGYEKIRPEPELACQANSSDAKRAA